jgi:adenylate cyclase
MIQVQGRPEPLESSPAISILVQLQRHGVPIDTVCGGRALCGRCLIRVLRGARTINPAGERERLRLAALGAGEDMRLACQSYTRGDIEIQIVNPRPAGSDP